MGQGLNQQLFIRVRNVLVEFDHNKDMMFSWIKKLPKKIDLNKEKKTCTKPPGRLFLA